MEVQMRSIFEGVSVLLLASTVVLAQERDYKLNIPLPARFVTIEVKPESEAPTHTDFRKLNDISHRTVRDFARDPSDSENTFSEISVPFEPLDIKPSIPPQKVTEEILPAPAQQEYIDPSFQLRSAMIQSSLFLAIQHGYRFTEKKTRDELNGPFFRDWKESVKNLRGWDDGGRFFTNYIGHPMQGAITGRIFTNNSGNARFHEFGKSKGYWTSRLKAMAWSAVWGTQFEIGPISEASLGNVGQKPTVEGRSKLSYGDLVMTPVGGTGLLIAEDVIDKYVLKRGLERRTRNRVTIKILRSVLTPMTGFANILRGHAPWWRDYRIN